MILEVGEILIYPTQVKAIERCNRHGLYLDVNCRFALLYVALEELEYDGEIGVME